MSIRCLQQGRLPALPISPAPMPDEPFIALTEVVSQALYGAPLTPDRDPNRVGAQGANGTLRNTMDAVRFAKMVWYGVCNPNVATGALVIFAEPPPPLTEDEMEQRLAELSRDPPDWLIGLYDSIARTGHDPKSVFNWMAKHDNDFTNVESSIAEACDRFYRILSQSVASGRIVLWGRRAVGDEPPSADHEPIDPRYLLTRRHHDLLSNELHQEVRDGDELHTSSRGARVRLRAAIWYHDIKTSEAHAEVMNVSAGKQHSGQDDTTATTRTKPTAPKKVRGGKPIQHHPPAFHTLMDGLFKEHGPLSADDPEWNANARVVEAVAEAFQKRHPREKIPGDTWLKEQVRKYLASHPDQDGRKRR